MDRKKIIAILSAIATFIASLVGVALGVVETSDVAPEAAVIAECEQTDFLTF